MAEHLDTPEQSSTSPEAQSEKLKAGEQLNRSQEQAANRQAEALPKLEAARQQAAEQARSGQEIAIQQESTPSEEPSPTFVNHSLKLMARSRLLKQVRQHLPLSQRALSRVVHQPLVDNMSEFGSKTVARPSGLLAGGICAFLGSSLMLWIDKHYGYQYNFLLWAILFVGGFIVGLAIEALLNLLTRYRKS